MFGTKEFVALNKTMQQNADHRTPLKIFISLVRKTPQNPIKWVGFMEKTWAALWRHIKTRTTENEENYHPAAVHYFPMKSWRREDAT